MAVQYTVRGPCTIVFGSWSWSTTEAGVIIRPQELWNTISADKYGNMPAALIHAGKSAEVEFVGMDVNEFDNDGWIAKLGEMSFGDIGDLVRATYSGVLTITDSAGEGNWVATNAFPLAPSQLVLSSVQEMRIPIVFRCLRDTNGHVFSSIPSGFI